MTDVQDQTQARPEPPGVRRWGVKFVGLLTALGVFGAIGAYYLPGVLDRLGATVTDREPFDVEFLGDQTSEPSYVFPAAVRADDVSIELLKQRNVAQLRRFAAEHGGVIAERQKIRFILRGRTEAIVHIDQIQVKVVERRHVIDDHGRPFVFTAATRARAYESLSGRPLVRAPSGDRSATPC